MTSKEKYEKIISTYRKSVVKYPSGFHTHHIYPKSIWPELKDNPENMVELPPIVHWYAHKLLNEAFIELGMDEYANKLSGCCDSIAQFINKGKDRTCQIDFTREKYIIAFLSDGIEQAIADHDDFIQKRKDRIAEWKSTAFVCIKGKAGEVFSVQVKRPDKLYMEKPEPMSLDDAKAIASDFGVPVTRYLTDTYAEKYGIAELPSIRARFDSFYEHQQLISRGYTKNMPEPLAFDITRDVILCYSFNEPAMPDIFNFETKHEKLTENNETSGLDVPDLDDLSFLDDVI